MAEEPGPAQGLRERKKQETRAAIHRAAVALFLTHGFDNVSVAQVAEAADVSKMTVFNYFPTKEDLVLAPLVDDAVDQRASLRRREPGESVVAALRRTILEQLANRAPWLGLDERHVDIIRVVRDTPSLMARTMMAEVLRADRLTAVLAEEAGAVPGDLTPRMLAAAFLGIVRALITENWRRIAAGEPPENVYADAVASVERAFDLLEHGFGGFGVRPA